MLKHFETSKKIQSRSQSGLVFAHLWVVIPLQTVAPSEDTAESLTAELWAIDDLVSSLQSSSRRSGLCSGSLELLKQKRVAKSPNLMPLGSYLVLGMKYNSLFVEVVVLEGSLRDVGVPTPEWCLNFLVASPLHNYSAMSSLIIRMDLDFVITRSLISHSAPFQMPFYPEIKKKKRSNDPS